MALNKSMHPRNRYKDKPPDFAYLASKYPEFQQHVHTNLTGRVGIEIPLERLIPTVPLRLNYIHWVEDLIGAQGEGESGPRRGIDIGTGASCIYPLLGATMNGWFFLATEVDDICFDYAKKNVEHNGLSDLIKVVKVPQKTLLMDALKEESALGVNSRNSRRPPPSSVNTGGVTEIMAEGGELEFVKRIIHDSLQLKKRLRWYSCMLGKKCSLAPLKEELRKQGVSKVTHTEFCQGRTMRWALAWSFYDDVTVPSPPCKKRKLEKARKPLSFSVLQPTLTLLKPPENSSSTPSPMELIMAWMEKTLTELRVLHKRVPSAGTELSLFLTAVENSWIHIRQRRRDHGRQLRELPRAPPGGSTAPLQTAETPEPAQGYEVTGAEVKNTGMGDSRLDSQGAEGKKAGSVSLEQGVKSGMAPPNPAPNSAPSPTQPPSPGAVQHFLFKCLLNVREEEEEEGGGVSVQMHWVEGQNRDLMNQLCTYLKNTLHRLASTPP
ncbi:hypothetical protein JZ751_009351 [Albula glossodonta]|uniref:U6 small nuclear RNA (adenine-(43)-N(6))-methyltransferase n=1 Tax=Albula glossodonta TaxID=121402 RepID=A0A8T2N828_9TELE|nr:hypothetical protein JZ751_009351 [Albula glossodonta]